MPSIPGGPEEAILSLLSIFAVGGSLGLIYRIFRQNTVKENLAVFGASAAVLIGFIAMFLQTLPQEPFLVLLGASSIIVIVRGLKEPQNE